MNNNLESQKLINLTKKQKSGTSLQLKFHIPKGMHVGASFTVDVQLHSENFVEKDIFVEAVGENKAILEFNNPAEDNFKLTEVEINKGESPVVVTNNQKKTIATVDIQVEEAISEVVPFYSLKLKNSQDVYKVGMSFVKDITNGVKHFGFVTMSNLIDDLHLLVYGSFVNYNLKKPVLIVVKDFNDPAFDLYRHHFTAGTIGRWDTNDWGDLCVIDGKQLNTHSENSRSTDFDYLLEEFTAVFWALPSQDVQNVFNRFGLEVLGKIHSVTYVIQAGETKNTNLNKSTEYYQCFDIAVKGVLIREGIK